MLDVFNIPGQQDNVKIFYASDTNNWQTWNKPRNCKFIWMMCMGAGAGGQSFTDGNGLGGGSGAVTRAIFPANVLPDILYVRPGAGAINAVGGRSFVSIAPNTTVMNLVCVSGTAGAGTTSLANGETIATTAVAGLLALGMFQSIAGIAGPGTTDYTPAGPNITNPGTTGRSDAFPTNILSVNLTPNITTPTLTGGGSLLGISGDSGIFYWKPLFSLGGCGGGANGSGSPGGKGGDGAYGSGGGGCGAGTLGSGTASGGKGGDGLVIIATF